MQVEVLIVRFILCIWTTDGHLAWTDEYLLNVLNRSKGLDNFDLDKILRNYLHDEFYNMTGSILRCKTQKKKLFGPPVFSKENPDLLKFVNRHWELAMTILKIFLSLTGRY